MSRRWIDMERVEDKNGKGRYIVEFGDVDWEAAKDLARLRKEDSLLRRALGFSTTETRLEAKSDELGRPLRGGKVIKITREVPPDSTAAIFWLKNRRPGQWRDKQDVAIAVDDSDKRIKEWPAVTQPSSEDVAALFADDEAE